MDTKADYVRYLEVDDVMLGIIVSPAVIWNNDSVQYHIIAIFMYREREREKGHNTCFQYA